MKYAFIEAHRPQFSIRAMCRVLLVPPSGFYAWLTNSLSKRADEDQRQTKLIKKAWEESGKVTGIGNCMMTCVIKMRPVAPTV